ncbi:MAG: hydrogenase formation protein HypD [Spirochaetia bacterium]|nr:hydrogenase formation protein HypD [Spirochaetia bacterium]
MKSERITLKQIIEGFRNPETVRALSKEINREAEKLQREVNIMEVCGGHTHIIAKYGLTQLIPENIKFIHGPGCPVCIMPKERIDHAVILAEKSDVILVTLGDMMRVPGSQRSLQESRSHGADVRFVYSPLETLKIAKENADKKVIFFAIGFETTTPMTASLIQEVGKKNITNLLFHINHVTVPEPMEAVLQTEGSKIDAFIGPSHVSVIAGAKIYKPIVDKYKIPVVISGFEPVDVMQSTLMIVKQFNEDRRDLEIQYTRGVTFEGNIKAQEMIKEVFDIAEKFRWRGIGDIPNSSLKLKEKYDNLNAEKIYHLPHESIEDHKSCRCGDILTGKALPVECKVFGKACTPDRPMGACMVSEEGACAAYYRYGRGLTNQKVLT